MFRKWFLLRGIHRLPAYEVRREQKPPLLPESIDVSWIFKCVANCMATKAFVLCVCACVLIKSEPLFWSSCIRVQMNVCQQQPRKQPALRSQVPSGSIHAERCKVLQCCTWCGNNQHFGAHTRCRSIHATHTWITFTFHQLRLMFQCHSTDSGHVLECCAATALDGARIRRAEGWAEKHKC